MEKIILAVLMVFVVCSVSQAATLRANWEPYPFQADTLNLWQRTEGGRVGIVLDIDPAETSVTFEHETADCSTFFLTGIFNGWEGIASDAKIWCQEIELPTLFVRPGQGVLIEIKVVN